VKLVVDTCVVLDVLEGDPRFGLASAECLARWLDDGLVVCPVSYVELAPAFGGSAPLQDEFLGGVGISTVSWTDADTRLAHGAWAAHVARRRTGQAALRPVADVLIGAFACRFGGLITRNPNDFRAAFPDLRIVEPAGR
jgi:predicted nucleic acid-binding protein